MTASELYELPSWKNAGYFALVSVDTDPVEQANLDKIGACTFLEYKKISEGKHPYITSECARFLPVYCSEGTEADGEEAYVYMFPKCLQVNEYDTRGRKVSGTLGGTFIPHTDLLTEGELRKLDKKEFKKLLDRNSMFFWGKPYEPTKLSNVKTS